MASRSVAPLVGAWIETRHKKEELTLILSHPSWVRGLKLLQLRVLKLQVRRTPRGCVD